MWEIARLEKRLSRGCTECYRCLLPEEREDAGTTTYHSAGQDSFQILSNVVLYEAVGCYLQFWSELKYFSNTVYFCHPMCVNEGEKINYVCTITGRVSNITVTPSITSSTSIRKNSNSNLLFRCIDNIFSVL